MKSIYSRLILIFISVIISSLIITFFISSRYFFKEILTDIQDDMNVVGENFISIYKSNVSKEQVKSNLDIIGRNYSITIYDQSRKEVIKNNVAETFIVKKDDIQTVLRGKRIQQKSIQHHHPGDRSYVIGIPFEKNDKKYALFIQPNFNKGFFKLNRIILFSLLTTLIVGTITFLFVAKLLVKPVKELTRATKEIARGNYDVRVGIKRKDEIGFLANQFNVMASKLSKIEEMRSEFVSNVSHEIQSPLTSIKGFAKVLRNTQLTDEKKEHYISIIEEQSERLSGMSDRLLKLASLDTDQHPFQPTSFKLDEQIRKTILNLEPLWGEKHLKLTLDLPETIITADPLLLEQVWINLLQNAIKFSSIDGDIYVSIDQVQDGIKVIVKDTGKGISESDIQRIFERFYQADRSRNRQGSGLGLSIVHKIVEMHKGKINVESKIGEGTAVNVRLPK